MVQADLGQVQFRVFALPTSLWWTPMAGSMCGRPCSNNFWSTSSPQLSCLIPSLPLSHNNASYTAMACFRKVSLIPVPNQSASPAHRTLQQHLWRMDPPNFLPAAQLGYLVFMNRCCSSSILMVMLHLKSTILTQSLGHQGTAVTMVKKSDELGCAYYRVVNFRSVVIKWKAVVK